MSSHFNIVITPLSGIYRIDRKPVVDHRGFFSRFFCAEEFKEIGLIKPIVQMNHTLTNQRGVIRGMHYQKPPYTETKIITCIQGEILDVVVDIRKGSPTFLQYHTELLSADNQSSLYVSDGFAHGFQTMAENCQLLYLHSEYYKPEAEGALNPKDPAIGINWPLEAVELSERDSNQPFLDSQFRGVEI